MGCPVCGPVEAFKLASAIALGEPERLVTLTRVGDTWAERRARMKRLRHDLVQELGAVEWAWSVEPNPRGTGHHVHAVQWGDFLPQRRLSQMADRRGMGRVVDVRALDRHAGSSLYLVKMAADAYGLKQATSATDREAFIDANGGRLLHTSRGFWRDGQERIRGGRPRRVAVARAMERMHGCSECRHHWSSVSPGSVGRGGGPSGVPAAHEVAG